METPWVGLYISDDGRTAKRNADAKDHLGVHHSLDSGNDDAADWIGRHKKTPNIRQYNKKTRHLSVTYSTLRFGVLRGK